MEPFATEQEALAYAERKKLRPTEFITTSRGARINVVATQDLKNREGNVVIKAGTPKTLKVRVPVHD